MPDNPAACRFLLDIEPLNLGPWSSGRAGFDFTHAVLASKRGIDRAGKFATIALEDEADAARARQQRLQARQRSFLEFPNHRSVGALAGFVQDEFCGARERLFAAVGPYDRAVYGLRQRVAGIPNVEK